MTSRAWHWSLLGAALASQSGCELVLGFEEHELGSFDGGAAGTSSGGLAGASHGGGGSGGQPGGGTSEAGQGGDPDAGNGGVTSEGGAAGARAGAGGAAGAGGECALCDAATALIHRYTFDGTGTQVMDSVGNDHGTIMGGASLSGTGSLTLAGATSDEYVNLPNGIVSVLGDASFEAWITWDGGPGWQRIFDFGSSTATEGTQDESLASLFATPQAYDDGTLRASFTLAGQGGEKFVVGSSVLATDTLSQVVVVIEGTTLKLYRNGVTEGLTGPIGALSEFDDVNNWLGRSQWIGDAEFSGVFHDFRIYDGALSAELIAALFAAGPDVTF